MDHMKQNIRIYQVPSGLEVLHSAIACFPHLWEERTLPMTAALAHRVSTITNAVYEGYHAALDI